MIEFNSQYNYENKSTFFWIKINPLILITTKLYILVKFSHQETFDSLLFIDNIKILGIHDITKSL